MLPRREAFAAYQEHLRQLVSAEAPALVADAAVAAVLEPAAVAARGRGLKAVEDQLDALSCAVAALIAWRDGLAREEVFGDAVNGYIAVPGMRRDARFMARREPC
jgi:predicted RNase H-like nuclease